jgi:gamma-glutamylputrescine oxidase
LTSQRGWSKLALSPKKTARTMQRTDNHPTSYYVATAEEMIEYPVLATAERADVCVIGGGFTGVSAALNLAEKGFDVVLLEAERLGFGASGRCGGLIGSGQRKDVLEMEHLYGEERSRVLWDFAEAAKDEIRGRVKKHRIRCDLQKGQIVGIHKRSYCDWPAELADALSERYDYPHCRALDASEAREMVATPTFLGGLWDAEALVLHPLNYVLGLARAASEAGVRIYENSRVSKYTHRDPAEVKTPSGSVKASFVVLACNGYLGKLERRVAGKIMPINNFMIATEPLGEEKARELISGRFGVHDTRFVVNYFRLSDDHRLLFGGGENYRPGFPRDIENFVRPYMLSEDRVRLGRYPVGHGQPHAPLRPPETERILRTGLLGTRHIDCELRRQGDRRSNCRDGREVRRDVQHTDPHLPRRDAAAVSRDGAGDDVLFDERQALI